MLGCPFDLHLEERRRLPVVKLRGEVKRGRAGPCVENAVVRRHGDAWVGTSREKQRGALAVVSKGGAHEGGHISSLWKIGSGEGMRE